MIISNINCDMQLIINKIIIPCGLKIIDIVDHTCEFCKDIKKCDDIKILIQAKLLGPKLSIKNIHFRIASITPTYDGGLDGFNTRKIVSEKYKNIFIKNSKFQNNKHNLRPYDTTDKKLPDILIVLIKSRDDKKMDVLFFQKRY